VVSWLVPQSKKCVTATAASNPVRNKQGFILYLCGLKKNRKKGSNTNCYIENCVWLLAENGHNRNATGKQILT
jgi:hypothetical protein